MRHPFLNICDNLPKGYSLENDHQHQKISSHLIPDLDKYYDFYEHVSAENNVQLEGVIDWGNSYTNLVENLSSIDLWTENEGIVDTMIEYELRRGLGLFNTSMSAAVTGVL